MFKVIRKQTRPNTSVPFWQGQNDPAMTDEFRNYFYETYVLTGKFISVTPAVSGDGLELTNTAIWNSEADYDASSNDPICQEGHLNKAEAHHTANGIILEIVSKENF
jgi:hypothetical protein